MMQRAEHALKSSRCYPFGAPAAGNKITDRKEQVKARKRSDDTSVQKKINDSHRKICSQQGFPC